MPLPTKDYTELYEKLRKADALAQKGDAQAAADAKAIAEYIKSSETADGPTTYGPATDPNAQPFPAMSAADSPPAGSSDVTNPALLDLAKRGVDIRSGAPVGNAKASFSPNLSSRAQVYEKSLSKHYGKPVKVTVDEKSGKLVYTDPSGKTRMIADSLTDPTRGGLAANTGSILPEIGQAIAGTKVGWIPGTAMVGAGEYARLQIGHALGADKGANVDAAYDPGQDEFYQGTAPYSQLQMQKDAAKATLENAVQQLPFLAAIKLPGLATWFLKGSRPFNPKVADKLLQESAKSDKLVQDVQTLAQSPDFKPFVSQKAGNFDALKMQDAVMQDPRSNSSMVQQQNKNIGEIQKGFHNVSPKSGIGGLQETLDAARLPQDYKVAHLEDNIESSRTSLGKMVDAMPNVSKAALRDAIDPALTTKNTKLKEEARAKYSASDLSSSRAAPLPPEYLNVGGGKEWRTTVQDVVGRTKQALSSAEKRSFVEIKPNLPNPNATEDELLLESLDSVDGTKDRSIPILAINDHIKFLNGHISAGSAGKPTVSVDVPTLIRLRDAAKVARADYLKAVNPQVLADVEAAEEAARIQGNFERKMIGEGFLKSIRGESGLEAKVGILEAMERTGDVKAAQELMESVSADPEAVSTLNNYALSSFKHMFKPDAQGNRNMSRIALDKASTDKLEVLKTFMTPEARKAMETTFDVQKVIHDQTLKIKQVTKAFNESFQGRVSKFNAEGINDALLGPNASFGIEDTVKLKNFAKQVGTYEASQKATMGKISDVITGRDGKDYHPDKLHALVQNSDLMNKMEIWLGKEYVTNLKTLDDGYQLATKTSGSVAALPGERSKLTDLARFLYAHPLTMEGRALTLLTGMRKEAFSNAVAKGLSDPEEFRKLIRWSKLYSDSDQYTRLAASMNASILAGRDYYGDVGERRKNYVEK